MTRSDAKKAIEEAGGRVTGSVSRITDYLIAGASPGSKLKRAEELEVKIITGKGQKAFEVERDNPVIDLAGII